MIDIEDCKSLNDIARKLYNKVNYSNREKVKKYLKENNIDWQEWLNNKKEEKQLFCLTCGKLLKRGQYKFCSCSCSASYNNKLRPHNPNGFNGHFTIEEIIDKEPKQKEEEYCLNCGKPLTYYQSKYCSIKCSREMSYKQYIERWKNGKEDGLKGEYSISGHIRRYLVDKYDCRCQLCGWGEKNQFTGTVPLEVHHIDGNYMNNKEENLQLLCPNCHSLTETFKNHNKSGRKGRKKYTENLED